MKTRLLIALFITSVAFTSLSCKRTKKASEDAKAKAEREARIAREREEKMKREEEERRRREEEDKKKAEKDSYGKVESYFNRIASASDAGAANSSINEALTMFSSPETPVLIVIHQAGEQKDYDKPTTIKKYLEYLKDQKKSPNAVNKLVYDNTGKIKEVELIKK